MDLAQADPRDRAEQQPTATAARPSQPAALQTQQQQGLQQQNDQLQQQLSQLQTKIFEEKTNAKSHKATYNKLKEAAIRAINGQSENGGDELLDMLGLGDGDEFVDAVGN